MGYYLNSITSFSIYESESKKPYFVDKTDMLKELIPFVEEGNNHICITRPRRFGKSIMAAMVASFFSKDMDSSCIFDSLKIAGREAKTIDYRKYMNQYNVIYINFIKAAGLSKSYEEFIGRVEKTGNGSSQ